MRLARLLGRWRQGRSSLTACDASAFGFLEILADERFAISPVNVMRPVSQEVAAGDFAVSAGHRLIAISLLVGTLNSAAAFSW